MTTLISKVFSGVTVRTLGQALTVENTDSPVPSILLNVNTALNTVTINGELIVSSFTFPTPLSIGDPPTLDPQALLQIYDNDATSNPQFVIQQGGTGDVAMRFNLSPYFGGRSFTIGIDQTGNDPFKIAVSEALGTNDVFLLDDVAPNIAIGLNALATVSGTNNTALGNLAGFAITSGSDNTLIAPSTGLLLTTGSRNTCLGRISTGGSGASLGATFNDTILIGNSGATVVADGEIWIGNATDHTSVNIPVAISLNSLTLGSPPVLFTDALLQAYDNDAGVDPQFVLEQDGSGDASFRFYLTGGQSYTIGIDNSTINDPFKISASTALGTNDLLVLDPGVASSSISVTGAPGADLTIETTAGSLVLNGGEAANDAVLIDATNVAGGITFSSGTGGIGGTSNGQIFFNSALSAVNAIELTASGATGGIDMNTNTGGYDLRSTGGGFLVDTTGTGSSQITTVGAAGGTGDLTITTSAGSLNLNGGEAVSDAVLIDATNAAGGVTVRYGTGGFVKTQPAPTVETVATTLTIAELLTQIIEATSPAGNQNYTLDTPANVVGAFANPQVNDCIDFHIINLGIAAADTITIVPGGIATSVGNMVVTGAGATSDQSQGHFRIRLTNVGGGTEDYIVYRIG